MREIGGRVDVDFTAVEWDERDRKRGMGEQCACSLVATKLLQRGEERAGKDGGDAVRLCVEGSDNSLPCLYGEGREQGLQVCAIEPWLIAAHEQNALTLWRFGFNGVDSGTYR